MTGMIPQAASILAVSVQPEDLLLLVPISYFVVFGLRWSKPNAENLSLAWIPPLFHLIAWSVTLSFAKAAPAYISAGWGVMTLSLVVVPLWFDREQRYPEWLQSSLLLGGLCSLLWTYLATSGTSTAFKIPPLATWLLAYVGFGLLLTSQMLSWQFKSNHKEPQPILASILNRVQVLSLAALCLSLTVTLLQPWSPTPLLWGTACLGLLSLGSSLLPTTQPAKASTNPSGMHTVQYQWNRWSSLLTLGWLFLHLIVAA